jgi:hypothetical protein
MMWFLSNWRLCIGAVFITAFMFLAWMNSERGNAIESMKITIAELAGDKEKCAKGKKLTEDTSHGYQQKLGRITTQLDAIKLRQSSKCIMPVAVAPAGRISAAHGGKPTRQDGISIDAIFDIAGQGERYRIQLKACQDFVNKVWESNK